MRLHHLEMRAFGPFAGTEQVDFDAVSDAGLFLLSGPTGAGKTSVLDAVCFALFGHVPGERDQAKRLRSDHAPADLGPRVVLDVTVRGRRMRITRSPEWLRPKKRGSGLTREPAKVLLEEQVDGRWHQRSGRIDEAADLLGGLLGVTLNQFCQVAMLPQGRFESFLKAGAAERHALLERLFDTRRFRAVEEWLSERRSTLARASAEHESRISTTVARIAEVSRRTAPADDDGRLCHDEDLLAWSAQGRDTVVDALAAVRARRAEVDLDVKRLRSDRDNARGLSDLQARHADALARRERLDSLDDDSDRQRRRIADARSAEAVSPVAALHEESAQRRDEARAAARGCCDAADRVLPAAVRSRVAQLLDETSPETSRECPPEEELARATETARSERARLTALLPAQQELDEVTESARAVSDHLAEQLESRVASVQHSERLQQRRGDLAAELAELEALTKDRTAIEQQVQAAAIRVRAAEHAERADARRRELADAVSEATSRAQSAREAWLDTRERRLDGMAAELASQLEPREPCPVCGAAEHPAPAASAGPPTTADDEQRAHTRFRELDAERERSDQRLRECETELAAAQTGADGLTLAAATAAHDDVVCRLEAACAAQQREQALRQQLADLDADDTVARDRLRDLDAELATLRERKLQLERRRDELEQTLRAAVGSSTDLPAKIERAAETEGLLTGLCAAVSEWRTAATEHAMRGRRLDQVLQAAGFDDLAQVRAATLAAAEISDLEALLNARAAERHQVEEMLADPAVLAAAKSPPVDLDALELRLAAQEEIRDAVVAEQTELARQADRLERLHSELDAAFAAWQPVRAEHRTARGLADLCAGTSADNPDRVRLSSYVLAARLSQVVDAANERLARMTAGRYLLERTDARGVGDRRGGLGLRVCDGWTGGSRDPATLSGGECFVASLALALGLADVVAYEAGGVELGTLFVDEGFGSLDAETLDEVLDVLDDLRSGGRVVGLVSHVPELRARVGAQIQVVKTRTGSTLVQV